MRIPLHANKRAVSNIERFDHWQDMMSLRRDNGGFRQYRTGKHQKQFGTEKPTRLETLARKAYQ